MIGDLAKRLREYHETDAAIHAAVSAMVMCRRITRSRPATTPLAMRS
jgi:hypothetical protein